MLSWSPDSKTLVAFRIEPGERKEVHLVESSPAGRRPGEAAQPRPYAAARRQVHRLRAVACSTWPTSKQIKPEVDRIDFGRPRLRWNKDGTPLHLREGRPRPPAVPADRGRRPHRQGPQPHRREDARRSSGPPTPRTSTCRPSPGWRRPTRSIYASETRRLAAPVPDRRRRTGEVKNQITKGECVVRGIDRIDEEKRQIWFRASGKNAGPGPVLHPLLPRQLRRHRPGRPDRGQRHPHGRSSRPTASTSSTPTSRVDMPPVHELRRADGRQARLQAGGGGHHRAEGERLGAAGGVRRQGPRRQDRHLGHHLPAAELRPGEEVPGDRADLRRPAGLVRAQVVQRRPAASRR